MNNNRLSSQIEELLDEIKSNKVASFDKYMLIANAFLQLEEFTEAKEYTKCAINIDETSPRPYLLLSHISLLKQNFDDSEENARRALEYDPDSFKGNYLLGLTLVNNNKQNIGIPYLQKAYSIDKTNEKLNNFLIFVLLKENRQFEANLIAIESFKRKFSIINLIRLLLTYIFKNKVLKIGLITLYVILSTILLFCSIKIYMIIWSVFAFVLIILGLKLREFQNTKGKSIIIFGIIMLSISVVVLLGIAGYKMIY